jgi:hypothetical protein
MAKPLTLITLAEFRRRRGGIARSTDRRHRLTDPNYPTIYQISDGVFGVLESEANTYIAGLPRAAPPEPKAATAALRAKRARGNTRSEPAE